MKFLYLSGYYQPLSHTNTHSQSSEHHLLLFTYSQLSSTSLNSFSIVVQYVSSVLGQFEFLQLTVCLRFSLRIAARSARLTAVAPLASKSQSALVARCVSSVARVPRLSTPSFFGSAQRRNFSDEALQSGPSDGMRVSARHRGPDGAPLQPTETLYVGNMQFDTTEQDLQNYFGTLGEIKGVKIIHDARGLSKG